MSLLRPRASLVAALLLMVSGCDRPPPPPPTASPRLRITLPLRDLQAAPDWNREAGPPRGVDTVVQVPDGAWRADAVLELPAFGGLARVHLGDREPVEVLGGPGGATLPLPDLPAGPLRVRIQPLPTQDQDPVRIGGDGARSSGLFTDPVLVLRPAQHVRRAVLVDDGDAVRPIAELDDAPDGATVRFVVASDGQPLAELGTAAVHAGRAEGAAQAWPLDRWTPADPALYLLFTELLDAEGRVLDRHAERVGVRQVTVTPEGLRIGGHTTRVAASRPMSRIDPDAVPSAVQHATNAIEFHGAPPIQSELADLDEVGLMAVLTPRCAGALRRSLSDTQLGAALQAHEAALGAQNDALAWQMASHPSAVLWVVELAEFPVLAKLWRPFDPQRRPVVGDDIELRTVMMPPSTEDKSRPGSFVVETAWTGTPGAATELTQAWAAAIQRGDIGGVIAHAASEADVGVWRETLAALGFAPPTPAGRRSRSVLTVTGAPAGEVAWLSGPWVPAVGTVVDATGRARIEAWHDGSATLHVGAAEATVELEPSRWTAAGTLEGGRSVSAPR